MKKVIHVVAAFIMAFLVWGMGMTAEAATKIVAIMPVQPMTGDHDSYFVAQNMTEKLTNVMANSGTYTVVERNQLDNAIKEMGFQQTGLVDSSTTSEFGKFTGAQYILVGKITAAEVYNAGNIPLLNIPMIKAKVSLDYRLLDVGTGQVLLSGSAEESHSVQGNSSEGAFNKSCKDVAEKVLKEIQQRNPLVGTVLDVDPATKVVYLDLGRDSGLKAGEKLMVYKEGAPVLGKNGEILATRTIELGEIKVEEVNDNHSVGKITDQKEPFDRGALVKRVFKK